MIDWVLDYLVAAGVQDVVINIHHLPGLMRAHLQNRTDVTLHLIEEKDILETGGGIKNAMLEKPALFADPFFVINADCIWQDGEKPALSLLSEKWDGAVMDALLLLTPSSNYAGRGDYTLAHDGHLRRVQTSDQPNSMAGQSAPYTFMGVRIVHPRLFEGVNPGKFSINEQFDAAQHKGRLFGLVHQGAWYHVGTIDELEAANTVLNT